MSSMLIPFGLKPGTLSKPEKKERKKEKEKTEQFSERIVKEGKRDEVTWWIPERHLQDSDQHFHGTGVTKQVLL